MQRDARPQSGILEPVLAAGMSLVFDPLPETDIRAAMKALRGEAARGDVTIGIGEPLARALGRSIAGLRAFPGLSGVGVAFPSTQGALWISIRAGERGEVFDRARSLQALLGRGWRRTEEVEVFRYRGGRDLTGYEDGTENPKDDAAARAAIASGAGAGIDGGSFVAVQRYVHDRDRFDALTPSARDGVIGRRLDTNEEMADAAATAHVKRSAQESFEPPAFMLRRSMPWGSASEHGLYFVAYVESLDRFERVLRRMAGMDDGTVDALLAHTRALSGGYYFCPPLAEGGLDLRALGL